MHPPPASSPVHCRNVGSRHGATVPLTPPCSPCPHRPPRCHPRPAAMPPTARRTATLHAPPMPLCPHCRTATLHTPPMPLCPPCHNVGSRHGATEPPSQPRSGNCRLTAHRDAPHRPPRCHPRPAALLPCTLRRCHFAHTAAM